MFNSIKEFFSAYECLKPFKPHLGYVYPAESNAHGDRLAGVLAIRSKTGRQYRISAIGYGNGTNFVGMNLDKADEKVALKVADFLNARIESREAAKQRTEQSLLNEEKRREFAKKFLAESPVPLSANSIYKRLENSTNFQIDDVDGGRKTFSIFNEGAITFDRLTVSAEQAYAIFKILSKGSL